MSQDVQQIWRLFLANRDRANFAPVYDRTRALVWTLCRRILMNDEDAQDAFQAAYTRLFCEIRDGALREKNAATANQFLYRLAVYEARNLRKRRARRTHREVSMDPLPCLASTGRSGAELAEQRQLRDRLETLMEELPEETRLPLQLHYFDGLTQMEIADTLEINQATISRRMSKGIKELEPLARRAGLGDVLPALGIVTLGAALLQPPAAFSAAAVFAQASLALAGASATASGMFVANSSATLKHSIFAAVKMKTAAVIASAAFVVGIGTILTLGAIHKSNHPAQTAAITGAAKNAEPTTISTTPGSKPDRLPSTQAAEKSPSKDIAQATVTDTNPGVQAAQLALLDADSKKKGVSAQAARNIAPPSGMLGPWSLAAGNPIFVNSYAIFVLGADNTDGNITLVLLSGEDWGKPAVQFLAYDAAGNTSHFIQTTSSTAANKTRTGEKISHRSIMYMYRLESPPPEGTQITSIAVTGDVEKFLAVSPKVVKTGNSNQRISRGPTENSSSNHELETLPAANSNDEEGIIQGPFSLADGNPIAGLAGTLCVVGADHADGNVNLAYIWPADDKEKFDALKTKFVGYDERGSTHNFIQTTSSTSQRDGEPGESNMNVYQLETPATTGFKIVSVAMTANLDEFKAQETAKRFKRAKGDMRLLATSIEAYYVDNKAYPAFTTDVSQSIHAAAASRAPSAGWKLPAFRLGSPVGGSDPQVQGWLGIAPITLTTPVSYIRAYPDDPFTKQKGHTYQFVTKTVTMGTSDSTVPGWLLWSPGPDGEYDLNWQNYNPADTTSTLKLFTSHTYDPTNGTNSSGDVWRACTGRGFQWSGAPVGYDSNSSNIPQPIKTADVPPPPSVQTQEASGLELKIYKIRPEDGPRIKAAIGSIIQLPPDTAGAERKVFLDGEDLIIRENPENITKIEELLLNNKFIENNQ